MRKVKPRARKDAQGFRHVQNARNEGRARTRARSRKVKPRARTRAQGRASSHAHARGPARWDTPRKPEDSGQSGQIRARTARKVGNRRARKNTERGRARKVAQGQAPSAQGCERASYCKTMHSSAFSGLTLKFRKTAARKDGRARSRKVRARLGQIFFYKIL